MKFLKSSRWRVFLIAWILYSVHFTTNIVREHYPAFSLVDHGTFRVDEYQGFHPDIFVHRDGHSVVGNQVFVSALAAIPLFIFDPALDAIERYSKQKLAEQSSTMGEYRTDKPNRVAFFRLVRERGLDLRFGAAAVVTSVFFMAPLTALFLVFMQRIFIQRGLTENRAAELALLCGFATPLFFRTSHLNHNMFIMFAMFISFALLWPRPDANSPISLNRRLAAGLFGGMTLAADYMGVILLPLLCGYLFFSRLSTASWKQSFRESLAFVVGSVPPVLFLLYTQWAMYGNPFLPGQHWMPDQNEYTQVGARGFTLPAPDLMLMNLFHPGYGIFSWGPVLLLALIPARLLQTSKLVLPRRERIFVALCFVVILLFSSANQYARLQWNSGFRYLVPMVPFMCFALADHWIRLPRAARTGIWIVAGVHSWVLTVFREQLLQQSWRDFLSEGIQLPWFRILRMTSSPDSRLLNGQIVPVVILSVTFLTCWMIWRYGARLDRRQNTADNVAPAAMLADETK